MKNCRLIRLALRAWAWLIRKPTPVDIRWSSEKGQVLSKAGTPYRVVIEPGDGIERGNEVTHESVLVYIPCNQNRWLRMSTYEQVAAVVTPHKGRVRDADVSGAINALVDEADGCVAAIQAAYNAGWRSRNG